MSIRSWLAQKRRFRAAEEMERVWDCWFLIFRRLHEETRPGPRGMSEQRFADIVLFHKMMVR